MDRDDELRCRALLEKWILYDEELEDEEGMGNLPLRDATSALVDWLARARKGRHDERR